MEKNRSVLQGECLKTEVGFDIQQSHPNISTLSSKMPMNLKHKLGWMGWMRIKGSSSELRYGALRLLKKIYDWGSDLYINKLADNILKAGQGEWLQGRMLLFGLVLHSS